MKTNSSKNLPEAPIPLSMKTHYEQSFEKFGPTSAGVDWGVDIEKTNLRYKKMLAVTSDNEADQNSSILDVGCGYGGLLLYMKQHNITMTYTGIDFAANMTGWAKENLEDGNFIEENFLDYDFAEGKYDYVVCNGILTQKLEASLLDMDKYAKALIHKMYSLSRKGIVFNIMSTFVNYFAPNLFYKHPAEILSYCLAELSTKVKIDHSYGLYEYTVYVYP